MTTVGELYGRYEALIFNEVAPGTVRGYSVGWHHRVATTFAVRDVETITTLDVEVAMAEWSGALSTRIDALRLLSAICRVALKGGVIKANPCVGVERPRVQFADPTSRALEMDEVERLFAVLQSEGPARRRAAPLG